MSIAILAIAAVTVLSIALAWFAQKRSVDALRRTAAELGYEFVSRAIPSLLPGGTGTRPVEAPEINAAPPATPTIDSLGGPEPPQGLKGFLSYFAPWRIRGREGKEEVSIYTIVRGSGRSRTTYTVVDMSAGSSAGGFSIKKEGFFSKVGKALFNLQDVQTGDPEFDATAMVKARDPEAVKRLLSSSSLRRAIASALDAYPGLSVTDAKISYERSGTMTRADFFRPLIAAMAEIAKAMREAS